MNCSVCGVLATHVVTRKRGPEALCGEHLEWLRANTTKPIEVEELAVAPPKETKPSIAKRVSYRTNHREAVNAYNREYYRKNSAKRIAAQMERAKQYPEAVRRDKKAYYKRNREQKLAYQKAYYARKKAEKE